MPQARGNDVSEDLRREAIRMFESFVIGDGAHFGKHVGKRISLTQLRVCVQETKAKAICEMVVEEDMLDTAQGVLHDGCSAYLIDMVTALPFISIGLAQREAGGTSNFAMAPFAPSQRLDIAYHYPARLGTRLRIVGKSVTHDASLLTVRGEIWDMDKKRLVASGTHVKVMPKEPPLAARLKL